jgi:pimeloyl-ACP methyl ester carboxylesterase
LQANIRRVHVGGADLAYVEQGEGDPVVFVHGGFSDFRSWEYQLRFFSKSFRALSYSLRYHYPNPWSGDTTDYSIPVHVKDLAALIEGLAASPSNIVGTSYGGRIALHLARDRPELVRTLVLAEPSLASFLQGTPDGPSAMANVMKNYFEPGATAIERGKFEEAARLFVDGVAGEGEFEKVPPEV